MLKYIILVLYVMVRFANFARVRNFMTLLATRCSWSCHCTDIPSLCLSVSYRLVIKTPLATVALLIDEVHLFVPRQNTYIKRDFLEKKLSNLELCALLTTNRKSIGFSKNQLGLMDLENYTILMKFGTRKHICNTMTTTWPNVKKIKIQYGGRPPSWK